MKNTRFSLHTDLENNEITLMCHFKLEGVKNHSTMNVFHFNINHSIPRATIDDFDRFKSICQVFGVSQKLVKEFMDECIRIACSRETDVIIEHETSNWLRSPDAITRLEITDNFGTPKTLIAI